MENISPTTGLDYLEFAKRPRSKRRLPMGNRRYEIKEIQGRQREIIRLHLEGLKNTQIAERLSVTTATVSNTLNSQPVVEIMAKLQEKADEKVIDNHEALMEWVPKAIECHAEILTAKITTDEGNEVYVYPAPTRQRSADRFLDSTGFGRIQRVQGQVVHGFLAPEDIEDIKRRALKRIPVVDIVPSANEGNGKEGGNNGK